MNQPIKLQKPVYGGDCLGHMAEAAGRPGKAVFVPLTLPGEVVQATIVEEKRTFARAELAAVLEPSPERITPNCPHFGACGGCHYQHAGQPAQLRFKQEILREALERAGVAAPDQIGVLASEPWGYRNRVRLALTADGRLAYRGRRSHDLIPIRMCPIAAPILMEMAERTADFLKREPPPLPITELELFTNHDESQLLVTLVSEGGGAVPEAAAESWLGALHAVLALKSVGLRLVSQNGALQPTVVAACGAASLQYTAAGVSYRVDHGAFFQVNRFLLEAFLDEVLRFAGRPRLVWDLYAGVGLFARQLADRGSYVHAVEAAPASLDALRHNLNGKQASVIAGTTLDSLRNNREHREPRPDLILLDPPRAGLGAEVTQLLNAIHAPELVYVSCDPVTLARDLHALTLERYRIEAMTLAEMFPQTFHMETVVHLRRI